MKRRRDRKWSKIMLSLYTLAVSAVLLMGCAGQEEIETGETAKRSSAEYVRAMRKAASTPYGRYPETITYTLAKMTDDNNSNLPQGDTYENNAYTRLIAEIINAQNKDIFEGGGDAYRAGISTIVATGELPDVMVVDQKTMYSMQKQGMLEDLTEAYERCAASRIKEIYRSYGEDIFASCTFDGSLMALPETNISNGPDLIWIRRDWMDQLGLKEPETIEDVEQIASAFARTNPGNAADGNVGLACSTKLWGGTGTDAEFGMDLVFASHGAYPGRWLIGEDGESVYGSVQPEMRAALEHLARMYENGTIDPDFLIRTSDDLAALTVKERCGIFFAPWWAPNNPLWECYVSNPEADWEPYLIATGEDGTVSYCNQKMTGNYVVVRKGYEHPEIVMKIVSVMFDYMRYAYDDPNGEFEQYYQQNIDPTARPLAINLDYNQALNICYENLSRCLFKKHSPDSLELLERSYYKICSQYLEDPTHASAESWSGYQSRITACSLLQSDRLQQVVVFYPMKTEPMEEYWYTLKELEYKTFLKIIRGESDITAFDEFVSRWYEYGGEQILHEVQNQMNRGS